MALAAAYPVNGDFTEKKGEAIERWVDWPVK
jgi:hypothetical protein